MKYTFLICFLFLSFYSTQAQTFKGDVAVFEKGTFDMTTIENWEKVGQLDFNKRGFIKFDQDNVHFFFYSSKDYKKTSIDLKFTSTIKKTNNITEVFPIVPSFYLKDKNDSHILVKYFSGEIMGDENKGIFVLPIQSENKIYFLLHDKNILSQMTNLYDK